MPEAVAATAATEAEEDATDAADTAADDTDVAIDLADDAGERLDWRLTSGYIVWLVSEVLGYRIVSHT